MHNKREKAEVLIMTRKEGGVEVNADKLSTHSYIEFRMQDEVTVEDS